MKKSIFLAIGFAMAVSVPTFAQSSSGANHVILPVETVVKNGVQYAQEGNYTEAVKCFSEAAERGSVEAQYNLGIEYSKGNGVSQSYSDAVKWFAKAAEKGYAPAQYNLGVYYENGLGVEQSFEQAFTWYSKAAEQDYADAQYNLGIIYYGAQEYAEAAKWWEKAAAHGLPDAQFNLATLYEGGFGVQQNMQKAITLYKQSAAQGNENAKAILRELGY